MDASMTAFRERSTTLGALNPVMNPVSWGTTTTTPPAPPISSVLIGSGGRTSNPLPYVNPSLFGAPPPLTSRLFTPVAPSIPSVMSSIAPMTTAAPAQQKLQITKTESAVAIIGSLTQALGAVFSRGASLTPAQAQAQAQVAAAAAVSGNPADVAAATTAEEAGKVAGKATGDFFETVRKNLGVISIGGLALVLFMSGRKR